MSSQKPSRENPSTELEEVQPRVFPNSLCHGCQGVQYTLSQRGSLFLMCRLTSRRYAPQPLLSCESFLPRPRGYLHITTETQEKQTWPIWLSAAGYAWIENSPSSLTWGSLRERAYTDTHARADTRSLSDLSSSLTFERRSESVRTDSPQLPIAVAPRFSLSLNDHHQLVLHLQPQRAPLLGWFDLRAHDARALVMHLVHPRALKLSLSSP